MTVSTTALTPLPHLEILRVTGADAQGFLQNQLSQGVENLSADSSIIAGWHDARGKVRAVLRVLREDSSFLLVVPASIAHQLMTAMRMFILRADVSIESAVLRCAGIVAEPGTRADLPAGQDTVAQINDTLVVAVAPGCWHVLGPAGAIPDEGGHPDAIVAAEIRAGLPLVDQNTALRYVPHMLNLDRLGAIDFEKGCYPGQEIIARTEHLGSVKRRARGFRVPAAQLSSELPGSDTPLVDASGERVGEVLRTARDSDGSAVVLAVVTLAALNDNNSVFLETPTGPLLEQLQLPFD